MNSRSAKRNSAAPAIDTMPAARPSSPSMRLIAFAISTTHEHGDERREVGREHHDARSSVNGIRKKNIVTPNSESRLAASTWPGDLGRRRHVAEVVERADHEHHARAEQQADRLGVVGEHLVELAACCDATAIATRKPTNIAAPPSVGVGCVCTCARVRRRRDDRAEPDREPPHDRRQQRTSSPSATAADDRVARHAAAPHAVRARQRLRVRRELGAEAVGLLAHLGRDPVVVDVAQHRGRSAPRSRASRSAPMPAVVTDAVPSRSPLVTNGFSGSFGIAFLLQVIPARSSASCATLPVTPNGRRSTSIRWLSVPPETMRKPSSASASASARGVAHDVGRVLGGTSGWLASRNATALAAITCMSGPPCRPGNTALSIAGRVLLAAEDRAGARAAQRLVRGERDDVGVRDRRRVRAAGDEPGDVRGVDEQQRADLVGDRAERREVDDARVRGGAGDDQLRPLARPRGRGSRRSRASRTSSSTPYATKS